MSAADQIARASAALARWPWIPAVEDEHGLPRWMLLAVGLRETGLRHIVGDQGHGHGPWQYDDRTRGRAAAIARIDKGDSQFAAEIAAAMLRALFDQHRDWTKALNAYNSGQTKTEYTTGHDYGPNVLEALGLLQRTLGPLHHPAPVPTPTVPTEDDMPLPIATNPNTGRYWVLTGPDGGIMAFEATGEPAAAYFGNLIDHPEYDAGAGKGNGPAVAIAFWPQGQDGEGYVIYCDDRAQDQRVRPYHFDKSTLK